MLNKAEVKKMVKEAGKRCGADFMSALEYAIRERVQAIITLHDGGKKTLNAASVHFYFGGKK